MTAATPDAHAKAKFAPGLGLLGSAFAGVNVFAHLCAWVGTWGTVGLFGNWVIDNWIPWTRKFWTALLDAIPIPNLHLSLEEKDALTALVFFVPAAVVAVFRPANGDAVLDGTAERKSWLRRALTNRWFVVGLGLAMLFLVARQITADLIALARGFFDPSNRLAAEKLTTQIQGSTLDLLAVSLNEAETLIPANGWLLAVLAVIGAAGAIWFWTRRRQPEKQDVRTWRQRFAGLLGAPSLLVSAPSAILALLPLWLVASEIGVVRTAAIALTAAALAITVMRQPFRVVQIVAFVAALIVAGLAWEAGISIYNAVEAAPMESPR